MCTMIKNQWNKKNNIGFFQTCLLQDFQDIVSKKITENRKKASSKRTDKIDWSNMCISKLDFHLSACDSCVILKYRSEIIHSRWTSNRCLFLLAYDYEMYSREISGATSALVGRIYPPSPGWNRVKPQLPILKYNQLKVKLSLQNFETNLVIF